MATAVSYCLLSCIFALLVVSFASAGKDDQDKQVIAQIILCY